MLDSDVVSPQQLKIYRLVAYSAVTFSVIAVFAVCLSLPLLYTYVSNVKSSISSELTFCQVRISVSLEFFIQNAAKDIWKDLQNMEIPPMNGTGRKIREAAGNSKYETQATLPVGYVRLQGYNFWKGS